VKYELGSYISEDDILHCHRSEILKSYICFLLSGKDGKEKGGSSSSSESDDNKDDSKSSVMERKLTNMRRNIREVMSESQLDEETLAAQRQEMERLRRVQEQQRIIREVFTSVYLVMLSLEEVLPLTCRCQNSVILPSVALSLLPSTFVSVPEFSCKIKFY
jgi:hypothetical protein